MQPLLLLAALAGMALSPAIHAAHWSYTGPSGSDRWGDMEEGFATCKLGKKQSPIDIKGAARGDLPVIGFNYVQTRPRW